MPKRNTAIDAIESMNAATLAASDAKAADLAKISAPIWLDRLAFTSIVADRKFNVRDDESYTFKSNEALYHSLKANGLEVRGGDNMSFSQRADGSVLTLTGHLRYEMMTLIRKEESDRRKTAGEPADPDSLPFAFISGLVFSNLSREQEIALMADHTMKKGLNEFELCKEVGEMIEAFGLTDAKAAIKFGIDKNKISRMRMRYSMPTVFAEYRKEKGKAKDVPFIAVGQKQLEALYTAYLADRSAGCGYHEEGMNFKAAWKIILDNPTAFKEPKGPKVASKDIDAVNGQKASLVATFGDSPEILAISDVLGWVANEERDGKPINLQTVISGLADYVNRLRAETTGLVNDNVALGDTVASLRAENEALRAENETLKAAKVKVKV